MAGFKKNQLGIILAAALWLGAASPLAAQADASAGAGAEKLDGLFAQLAEPGREDWRRVESEILRIWAQSGSESMDLLLKRGQDAMEAEDYPTAIEHLSALTELAPGFAEGWNARATAFFLMDEYALSVADIERTLALEPRHFGALSGLGQILEALGEDALALEALRAAYAISPNRPGLDEAVQQLERLTGAADL